MPNPISICKKEIKIKNLILDIYLGFSELEQAFTQAVAFSFKFNLAPAPLKEDNLDDLLCYDRIIIALKDFLLGKKYKTVEYLTEAVYFFLSNYSSSIKNLKLSVKKLNPPVSDHLKLESVKINIGSE